MRDAVPPPSAELLAQPEAVVTGEAVLLELRPASVLTRMLAIGLDLLVQLVLLIGLTFGAGLLAGGLDASADAAIGLVAVVLVIAVVPAAWEALSRGRSPGKLAAGLRVVRDDGGPVRARHAVVRSLVGVVELWTLAGSAALVCALASPRGKRIGDLLAGTVVVRERAPAALGPPVPAPPELLAWARAADIGRLPDAVAAAARQVLARGDQLHPASRERLLAELAEQARARVSPPPPPGTPPERLLAAVLAERRERDHARLRQQRARRDALAEQARALQGR